MTANKVHPRDYQAPQQLLTGHNILVTGAGDGIGKVAAQTYAASGATVILLGRTSSKLEAVYDSIKQAGHPQPIIIELDMLSANRPDYLALRDNIAAELGSLHGLLHNAGILGERTPIQNADPQQWLDVMQVNVNAQHVAHRCGPRGLSRRGVGRAGDRPALPGPGRPGRR